MEQAAIQNPELWQEDGRYAALYASATSYNTYRKAGPIVVGFAKCFGPFDWLDEKCTRVGLSSMNAFDDKLDGEMDPGDDPELRLPIFNHCVGLVASPRTPIKREIYPDVRPALWDNVELFREMLAARNPDQRGRALYAMRRVGELSLEKAATEDFEGYLRLLAEEGRLVAHWVLGALGYCGSLRHRLLDNCAENIAVAGVLVMAAKRLPASNEAGRAGLAPTRGNRGKLALRAVPYLARAAGWFTLGATVGGISRLSARFSPGSSASGA